MRYGIMLAALALAGGLEAQRTIAVPVGGEAPRGYVGGGVVLAQPTGDFANYVDFGGGLAGHGVWTPGGGPFGLRLDANFLIYGSETRRYQLVPLIDVDVTTNNQIVGLQLGPELAFGPRAFRPYVLGQGGFSYFATTSSVEGSGSGSPFAETTNFDDFTWAASLGGGVRIKLSDRRSLVTLDLGVRYVLNGRAQYLREGSIVITSGGDVTITPIESETNLMIYHIGVSVGLRPAPRDRR